jgi:hypothetical protein
MYARRQVAAGGTGYVLLLNTAPADCDAGASRIVHLPAVVAPEDKARFLAACDACVHARASGESFGLAVAECAMAGLPVLTHGGRGSDGDYHLRTLGRHALTYHDGAQLRAAIDGFDRAAHKALADTYAHLYDASSEAAVMIAFLRAFRPDQPAKC